MIERTTNPRGQPAMTSNHWHVVHARWERNLTEAARFERKIVSEHEDRATAVVAARGLMHEIVGDLAERPLELRDQLFVRKPGQLSLERAHRLVRSKD